MKKETKILKTTFKKIDDDHYSHQLDIECLVNGETKYAREVICKSEINNTIHASLIAYPDKTKNDILKELVYKRQIDVAKEIIDYQQKHKEITDLLVAALNDDEAVTEIEFE